MSKQCSKCGAIKQAADFYQRGNRPSLEAECKDCHSARMRGWYVANRDRLAEQRRRPARVLLSEDEKRERERAYAREYYAANRERIRGQARRWRAENREQELERSRAQHDAARAAVFGHYGQSCECCGTTDRLTIDHVNGDGRRHREEISHATFAGAPFYAWLVKNGFPPGFQVLCRPCNQSKGRGERCRLVHNSKEVAYVE